MCVPSRNCTIAACLLLMVTIVAATPLRGQVQKDASGSPVELKEGQTPEEVEKMLGKPADLTKVNEDLIYVYPTLKVYFERGKLVNVEQRKITAQKQSDGPSEGVLTNSDIVKMSRAKLADSIIVSTIKSSPSNFDTSVDDMVKLKTSGVSDAVIQAMRDVQEAAKAAEQNEAASQSSLASGAQAPVPSSDNSSFDLIHLHGDPPASHPARITVTDSLFIYDGMGRDKRNSLSVPVENLVKIEPWLDWGRLNLHIKDPDNPTKVIKLNFYDMGVDISGSITGIPGIIVRPVPLQSQQNIELVRDALLKAVNTAATRHREEQLEKQRQQKTTNQR